MCTWLLAVFDHFLVRLFLTVAVVATFTFKMAGGKAGEFGDRECQLRGKDSRAITLDYSQAAATTVSSTPSSDSVEKQKSSRWLGNEAVGESTKAPMIAENVTKKQNSSASGDAGTLSGKQVEFLNSLLDRVDALHASRGSKRARRDVDLILIAVSVLMSTVSPSPRG